MPYRYEILTPLTQVRVTAQGKVDFASALVTARAIAADAEYQTDFSLVIDLRAMDFVPSTADVHGFTHELAEMKSLFQGPIALLTQPGLPFGLARMTSLIAERSGLIMGAFGDEHALERWLAARTDESLIRTSSVV